MPKKITTLTFTLFALLVSVPAFADGLQGLAVLGYFELAVAGSTLGALILVILNMVFSSRVLNIFAWIFIILFTAVGGWVLMHFQSAILLSIDVLFIILQTKKFKSRPTSASYSIGYFLKIFVLCIAVEIVVVALLHRPSQVFSKTTLTLQSVLMALLPILFIWAVYKLLRSRIVAHKKMNALTSMLYMLIMVLPFNIMNNVLQGAHIPHINYPFQWVINALYGTIILGLIAYYLVPKKKDRVEVLPDVEAES